MFGNFFYHFWKYLQSLNPTSQIPNNFHTKLGKVEILISLDRKLIST